MSQNEEHLDPYRSPAIDAIPIDDIDRPLTRTERTILEMYYEHRNRSFRMFYLVKRMLPNWLFLIAMMSALLILLFGVFPRGSMVPKLVFVGTLGALVGAVTRDVGVARRLVVLWPLLRDVFDWQRVARRLDR